MSVSSAGRSFATFASLAPRIGFTCGHHPSRNSCNNSGKISNYKNFIICIIFAGGGSLYILGMAIKRIEYWNGGNWKYDLLLFMSCISVIRNEYLIYRIRDFKYVIIKSPPTQYKRVWLEFGVAVTASCHIREVDLILVLSFKQKLWTIPISPRRVPDMRVATLLSALKILVLYLWGMAVGQGGSNGTNQTWVILRDFIATVNAWMFPIIY